VNENGSASPPRVALFLPTLEGGGAERVLLNLAAGFCTRGIRTDLVLGVGGGSLLPHLPAAVRLIQFRASRVAYSLYPLAEYLRRERPTALLAGLDHANLVAMAARRLAGGRTRTVITVHCTFQRPESEPPGLKDQAIPWLLGRLHHWADEVVAVSKGVADDLSRATGMPRERIAVIYNPVVTPTLIEQASRAPGHPWFEDPDHPVVIGVGRLVSQKNFRLLIDAFAKVKRARPSTRLVILGEGDERNMLEEHIQRLGLQQSISLPGFIENPYACMARAGVFVLSSDFAGLPTALIESLAVGTPVVSTDCLSGPREILQGGRLGELVPVGNVEALARGIERALAAGRRVASDDILRPYMQDVVMDQFMRACHLNA
jgi:glycosyltransferase involved in cell wall biosynthesis